MSRAACEMRSSTWPSGTGSRPARARMIRNANTLGSGRYGSTVRLSTLLSPSWSKRQATVIPLGIDGHARVVQLGRQRVGMVPDQVDRQPAVDLLGRKEGFPASPLFDGAGQGGRLLEHAIARLFQHGAVDVHGLVVEGRLVPRGQIDAEQSKHNEHRRPRGNEQEQALSSGHTEEFPYRRLDLDKRYCAGVWINPPRTVCPK